MCQLYVLFSRLLVLVTKKAKLHTCRLFIDIFTVGLLIGSSSIVYLFTAFLWLYFIKVTESRSNGNFRYFL